MACLRSYEWDPYHIKICVLLSASSNCHNPTNNPKELKTTFVGVVLLSVKKTTTTGTHYNFGSSKKNRKLIFGMQPYFNPTR